MKICNSLHANPIIQKNKTSPISFKSSFRSVYSDVFVLKYNTNTCFFRTDLEWGKFVDYLDTKYKNTDKVNIINYACSTGEEPASLAMMLDIKLKDNANKFFPIKAYDIDEENIKKAQKGFFNIYSDELRFMRDNTISKYKDYFNVFSNNKNIPVWIHRNDKLASKIIYEQADILKNIHEIPRENTVLFCRNFLPYLQIGESRALVKQIGKLLKPSSIVVLGKFEIDYGIEKLFEKEGFRHTNQYNVMEKMPSYKFFFTKILQKMKIK